MVKSAQKKELELKKAVLEYFDQLIIIKVSEVISDEDALEIDTITKLFSLGKIDRERVILNASIIFSKYDLKGIYADFIQIVIPEKILEFEKTGFVINEK